MLHIPNPAADTSGSATAGNTVRTRLTLRPGDNGTKKLVRKYGTRLLAVRYRYDAATQRRFKIELIEEELPWEPLPVRHRDDPVLVRVAYEESQLRKQVKAAGAQWSKERRLWQIRYAVAQALGLESRIVGEE